MATNTMKRPDKPGYIVRDTATGQFVGGKPSASTGVVKMPDGRVVKVMTRDVFDKAVREATKGRK